MVSSVQQPSFTDFPFNNLKFCFDFIMTLAPISHHVVDLLVCEVVHNCGEDSVNYGVPLPIVVF